MLSFRLHKKKSKRDKINNRKPRFSSRLKIWGKSISKSLIDFFLLMNGSPSFEVILYFIFRKKFFSKENRKVDK